MAQTASLAPAKERLGYSVPVKALTECLGSAKEPTESSSRAQGHGSYSTLSTAQTASRTLSKARYAWSIRVREQTESLNPSTEHCAWWAPATPFRDWTACQPLVPDLVRAGPPRAVPAFHPTRDLRRPHVASNALSWQPTRHSELVVYPLLA